MKIYNNFLLPVGLLAGTIIGAGVFSLPYVFSRSGLTLGFFYLIIAAIVSVIVHSFYADVIMHTSGEHRFPGYVRIYLGRVAQLFAIWSAVIEAIVVLTIYLLLSVRFAQLITGSATEAGTILIFWLLGSCFVFFRVRRLAVIEFFITFGIVAILFALFIFGLPAITRLRIGITVADMTSVLLPLAPILFALSGRVAIPLLVRYFRERHVSFVAQHDSLRRVIFSGTIVPALLYGLFALAVVALSPIVTDDAVTGLMAVLPLWLLQGLGILGLLSLFSSYIVVGRDVYSSLLYDLQIYKFLSGVLVVATPLALYVWGAMDFIELVTLVGGTFLAFDGIMIVLMWFSVNARGTRPLLISRWIGYPFAVVALVVFSLAFVSALW